MRAFPFLKGDEREMSRTPPMQTELDHMLRVHLSFEINRFRLGISVWNKQQHGQKECLDAMIRESCLLHMRLLLDFFYPRPKAKVTPMKDIFVDDYFPDRSHLSENFQNLLKEPDWTEKYRDRLDAALAHLTMRRMDFESNRAWHVTPPIQPSRRTH
jgi:hypothetical protein